MWSVRPYEFAISHAETVPARVELAIPDGAKILSFAVNTENWSKYGCVWAWVSLNSPPSKRKFVVLVDKEEVACDLSGRLHYIGSDLRGYHLFEEKS